MRQNGDHFLFLNLRIFNLKFEKKVFFLSLGTSPNNGDRKKLFVAFPWVKTSTGPGGFMICVFII